MIPMDPASAPKKTFILDDVRSQYIEKLRDAEMIIGLTNSLEQAIKENEALKKEIAALKDASCQDSKKAKT